VVENLRIVGIKPGHLQGDLHSLSVTVQSRVSPFQLETTHALRGGIGGLPKALLQAWQRLLVAAKFRQAYSEQRLRIG
jgi:hypothetical protein